MEERHGERDFPLYRWRRGGGSKRSQRRVYNPTTGEVAAAQVALASSSEVRGAVQSAKAAAPRWAATTPLRRARILNQFLHILEERLNTLAEVINAEHGKVISDAKGEIQRGMEVVEFATAAPQLLKGEVTENVGTRVSVVR